MKSERNSCVENDKKRAREREVQTYLFFSPPHTADWSSRHDVGANIGSSISESYRNGRTQMPLILGKVCVSEAIIQQAVQVEYTGSLMCR